MNLRQAPHPLTFAQATRRARGYRCAECWSHLNVEFCEPDPKHPDNRYCVVCAYCGEPVEHFVTVTFVTKREAESHYEASLAKSSLRDNVDWIAALWPHLTEAETLKVLGY